MVLIVKLVGRNMGVRKGLVGFTLSLLMSSGMAVAADSNVEAKPYQRGDCITATDQSYSWVGKFARIEAYSSIDGFGGKNYVLLFYGYQTKAVIFDKSIEAHTVKVDSRYCE